MVAGQPARYERRRPALHSEASASRWPPECIRDGVRATLVGQGVVAVKKGRHRRFEEARSLKRSVATASRRCPECGAEPDDKHASWCLVTEDDYDEILGTSPRDPSLTEDDPLAE
jgi:hypothetical protein